MEIRVDERDFVVRRAELMGEDNEPYAARSVGGTTIEYLGARSS